MMSNLFSTFDTSTNSFFDLNWLSSFLNFIMMFMSYWFFPSRLIYTMTSLKLTLFKELKMILNSNFNLFNSLYFITIFFIILLNNFMGLFPYIFTSSSHLIFSLSISLPMWLSFMILGWFKNYNHMFAHMIPQNTPFILMPFMVLIETISNIIRPLTLTVRLTANMIAGHLLLTLMSQSITSMPLMASSLTILLQILLLILEMSVSIIQSYVFMVLSSLYSKEIT